MIQIQALSKRNGDNLAVHDMSFTVRPGQVTGAMGLLPKAGTAAPLAVRPTARQRRQLPPRAHFGCCPPTPPSRAGEPTASASATSRCTDAVRALNPPYSGRVRP
jgi:hypothetical protein